MERSFQIVAQWLQENDPDKVPPFNQPATEDENHLSRTSVWLRIT